MPLYALNNTSPRLPESGAFWIAPSAEVIGDVRIGESVGIWFGAVLRSDNEPLTIGARSNVQEHVVLHADPGCPLVIGEGVTIGHRAIVHGCEIGDNSLVGMGAIILNGAKIGRNCLIGAVVGEGKEIPEGSLVLGISGKSVKALSASVIAGLARSAETYVANWRRFRAELAAAAVASAGA